MKTRNGYLNSSKLLAAFNHTNNMRVEDNNSKFLFGPVVMHTNSSIRSYNGNHRTCKGIHPVSRFPLSSRMSLRTKWDPNNQDMVKVQARRLPLLRNLLIRTLHSRRLMELYKRNILTPLLLVI